MRRGWARTVALAILVTALAVPPAAAVDAVTAAATGTAVTVTGQVRWADDQGGLHPVRDALVVIEEHDLRSTTTLGRTRTDQNGVYRYVHPDNDDGLGQGGLDLSISVAADPVFVPTAGGALPPNYVLDSATVDDVADGATVHIDLDADSPTTRADHAAFSIRDAVLYGEAYSERVVGRLSRPRVFFPMQRTAYEAGTLLVRREHWIEWDVLHHEYAHHVQESTGTGTGAAEHYLARNMAEFLGKGGGVRAAWGEGWPTWFAVVLQQELGLSALGIANVGNTDWEDRTAGIDVDLEAVDELKDLGEDNEVSVSRILWDLYDGIDDQRDRVSQGALAVLGPSLGKDRLDAFWQAVVGDTSTVRPPQVPYACVFADHDVAPDTITPGSGTTVDAATPPTFSWHRNGGGAPNPLDEFTLELYTPGLSRKLLSVSDLVATSNEPVMSWTPSAQEWASMLRTAGPRFTWLVKGHSTRTPRTPSVGDYVSCPADLLAPRREVSLLIDRSAPMLGVVGALAERAPEVAAALAAAGHVRVSVATYDRAGVVAVVLPLTDDLGALPGALAAIDASSEAPPGPGLAGALLPVADGEVLGGWGDDVARSTVVVAGATPPPSTDASLAVALASGAAGAPAGTEPLTVHAVATDPGGPGGLAELADLTGGTVRSAADGDATDAVVAALGVVGAAPVVTTRTVIAGPGTPIAMTAGAVGPADPLSVVLHTDGSGAVSIGERLSSTWPVAGREVLAEVDLAFRGRADVTIALDPTGLGGLAPAVALAGRSVPRCGAPGAARDHCVEPATPPGSGLQLHLREAGVVALTVPVPTSTSAACPSIRTADAFLDVASGQVHAEPIACLAARGLLRGTDDGRFRPLAPITRAQTASILHRLLLEAGVDLPAGPDAFADDDGSVHEASIDALAAAGVLRGTGAGTFGTSAPVTRGQLAALLARAAAQVRGAPLPPGPDAFADDDGSVHEPSIDALAQIGVATGTTARSYLPAGAVTRAQAASLLARLLSWLIADGWITAGAASPT